MRTKLQPFLALVAMLALTQSFSAEAQTRSFRCKNDLVNLGDDKASAALKCGEPVFKDSFCKPGEAVPTPAPAPAREQPRRPQVCETVDEWTYNPGYGQFMTTLRFESGRLVSIRYGDRVK